MKRGRQLLEENGSCICSLPGCRGSTVASQFQRRRHADVLESSRDVVFTAADRRAPAGSTA